MTQLQPLPERLQYLQPFREFLANLKESEVGDGMDTTLLEQLIYKQIRGKPVAEAREKLNPTSATGDLRKMGGGDLLGF